MVGWWQMPGVAGEWQPTLSRRESRNLKQRSGAPESGVVVCFSPRESFFIRPNVVFVGFMMDSETRSFTEPLQVATSGL